MKHQTAMDVLLVGGFVVVSCLGLLFPVGSVSGAGAVVYAFVQDIPLLCLCAGAFWRSCSRTVTVRPGKRWLALGAGLVISVLAVCITETKGMSLVFLGSEYFPSSAAAMHFETNVENLLSLPYIFIAGSLVAWFVFVYIFRTLKVTKAALSSFVVLPLVFAVYHLRFGADWTGFPLFAETFFVGVFFTLLVWVLDSVLVIWPFLVFFEMAYYVTVDAGVGLAGLCPNALFDLISVSVLLVVFRHRSALVRGTV